MSRKTYVVIYDNGIDFCETYGVFGNLKKAQACVNKEIEFDYPSITIPNIEVWDSSEGSFLKIITFPDITLSREEFQKVA